MPNVTSHDAVIYAENNLITALTTPQPTNSVQSIGNDQLVALRKLATIFQCSIQQKQQPIAEPGKPDIAPPRCPRTRSQSKALANAAIRAIYSPTVRHTTTKPHNDPEKDAELASNHLCDIPHDNKPHIVPIIKKLRPQYHTKHNGMVADPFPLIQSANSIVDPSTGKQLEYKQLINHPDRKFRQMWQCSSANEFGCLAQDVGGRIEGTDTIKFLRYHEMPKNRRPTYACIVF